MRLSIISPEKRQSFSVAWLEVQTNHGSFVVQQGHAPMVLLLKPNEPILFRLKTGKQESIIIGRGVIEINREHATVLINKAQ